MLEQDNDCPTVVIDLDGTLCDDRHRSHLAEVRLWDEYHGACHLDNVHPDMEWFLDRVPASTLVIALTGRSEKWRGMTTTWMLEKQLASHIDELIMRPDEQYLPASELKIKQLEERFGSKEAVLRNVILVLENSDKIVAAMRDYGLTTWQTRPGA